MSEEVPKRKKRAKDQVKEEEDVRSSSPSVVKDEDVGEKKAGGRGWFDIVMGSNTSDHEDSSEEENQIHKKKYLSRQLSLTIENGRKLKMMITNHNNN